MKKLRQINLEEDRRDWLGYPIQEDREDEVDGRWIDAVAEYASTCDGCSELTMHDSMEMDHETQFGFCERCMKNGTVNNVLGRDLVPYSDKDSSFF